MRKVSASIMALALVAMASVALLAQGAQQGAPAKTQDANRTVADGGIFAPGWVGRIDPNEAANGAKLEDAKLTMQGDVLTVTTGPATTYWNPANTASGDYTVKATFNEPQYMNINDHPHPYGIFIAGNDMDTENATFLYCAAYGNGTFIVRGFGPAPFQMSGRRGTPAPSINKAAGRGSPVSQEIAMSVSGDNVTCSINGQEVARYTKADLVGPGKLKSTDGIYGVRFAHNTDGTVTALTKN